MADQQAFLNRKEREVFSRIFVFLARFAVNFAWSKDSTFKHHLVD